MIKEAEGFSTMRSIAAKNASSYMAFVAFLCSSAKFIREILDDIGKVQLDMFEDPKGVGFPVLQLMRHKQWQKLHFYLIFIFPRTTVIKIYILRF